VLADEATEALIRHIRAATTNGDGEVVDDLPEPIDWHALFKREHDVDWLVEDVWPAGRQLHIFAARKTGKSLLMLWIAACMAAGRDPFTDQTRERVRVAYLDYEMTEDDVLERVDEMGFTPDDLAGWLIYYLWPVLPPMDTAEGGTRLMRLIERDSVAAVVLDTVSRVVQGDENSADTYRAFFTYTGLRLKRAGIAMARLDHEGHEGGRSRGSSAKADDVDVVWRLQATDDGMALVRNAARMSWIPKRVELHRRTDPLSFTRTESSWPAGTKAKADELDAIGAPINISKRVARELLKGAGLTPGTNEVLLKAIAFRRQQGLLL
jgi:RecA-family ATPase